MIAILQKKFLSFKEGSTFNLKEHPEHSDLLIFESNEIDYSSGQKFWLTKDFVLGNFEEGYKPLCWTKDLFLVI